MNQLPEAKRVLILRCLVEGMSVRGTARVTGVSKGAVQRLIAEIGPLCEQFHHRLTPSQDPNPAGGRHYAF